MFAQKKLPIVLLLLQNIYPTICHLTEEHVAIMHSENKKQNSRKTTNLSMVQITFKFSGVNSNGIEGLFSGVSRC